MKERGINGRKYIQPEELTNSSTESQYKIDGKAHEQRRDIAKFWKNENIELVLIGLENQTQVDKDMVFRVLSYDGASYRAQLIKKRNVRYPVVTIVLYFGLEHWSEAKSIHERIAIPSEFMEYVNNYKLHVFEIAYLTDEQVMMFQSDFRIVADYFVQMRKNGNYQPSKEIIQHVDALLQMMSALTKDYRFETVYREQEGGPVTMCEVLDRIEERGIEKGLKEGLKEGEARINTLYYQLIQQKRMDDLIRATTDEEFREKLCKEFNL